MGAHPLAPDVDRRDGLLERELGQREHRLGPVDDDLVRAAGGSELNSSARDGRVGGSLMIVLTGRGEGRVEVGDDADGPALAIGSTAGTERIELRRGAVLVARARRSPPGRSPRAESSRARRRAGASDPRR